MAARLRELLADLTQEFGRLEALNTKLSEECDCLREQLLDVQGRRVQHQRESWEDTETGEPQPQPQIANDQPDRPPSHWRADLGLEKGDQEQLFCALSGIPLEDQDCAALRRPEAVSKYFRKEKPALQGAAHIDTEDMELTGPAYDSDEVESCADHATRSVDTLGRRRSGLAPCDDPVVTRWQELTKSLLDASLRCYILRDCWQEVDPVVDTDSDDSFGSREKTCGVRRAWESMQGQHHHQPSFKHSIFIRKSTYDASHSGYSEPRWHPGTDRILALLCHTWHPHSSARIAWNVLCLMITGYDVFRMSIEVFEPGRVQFFELMDWLRRYFWILDVRLSFSTAFFTSRSLELRRREIARRYIATWLVPDLLALAADWALWLLSFNRALHSNTLLVQGLSLLRLSRVAKCRHLLLVSLERVRSVTQMLLINLSGCLLSILAWVHFSGCVFYAIGRSDEEGWTEHFLPPDPHPAAAYFASTHWAVVQLQGSTNVTTSGSIVERCFAVFVVLVSIVFLAILIGKLTNVIMQLQNIWNESARHLRALNLYMDTHQISTDLSLRVKKYAEWKLSMDSGSDVEDDKLLLMLPNALRREVVQETHGPRICRHAAFSAFADFNPRFVERICCDLLRVHHFEPDDAIYNYGEACSYMYFVVGGELQYLQYSSIIEALLLRFHGTAASVSRVLGSRSLGQVGGGGEGDTSSGHMAIRQGQWLCEGVLWTSWTHRGDLCTETHSTTLLLDGNQFGLLVDSYPMVRRFGATHAKRFIRYLNIIKEISDLFDTDKAMRASMGLTC